MSSAQVKTGLLAAITAMAAACSTSPPAPADIPTGLTIGYPSQGTVIATSQVEVGGRAPAGARVVQDISLAPDQEVIAESDGSWKMVVDLDEGANDLVFRLGDDDDTEQHLGLTYDPAGAPGPGPGETDEPPAGGGTAKTFGDGTFEIGADIKAGTYRLRQPADFCYWARLSGFGGRVKDILANENVFGAYAVVTIKASDAGFESSDCDEWSSDLSRVTTSKSTLNTDGTYIVGTDLAAGKWRATGGEFCYWARLDNFTGSLGGIIANDNVFDAPTIVTINSSDAGFQSSGCGTWTRQ